MSDRLHTRHPKARWIKRHGRLQEIIMFGYILLREPQEWASAGLRIVRYELILLPFHQSTIHPEFHFHCYPASTQVSFRAGNISE